MLGWMKEAVMDEQGSGRVVVGVSASLAGLEALRYGVAEARRRQVALHAVRVWQVNVPWRGAEVRRWRDQIAEEALRCVSEAFDAAMGGLPRDIDVAVVAPHGRPDLVLTGIARDRGDLLVLGGRNGRRSGRLVRACTRRATCPVAVVPPPALARGGGSKAAARRLVREAEQYALPGH
jgi:nucleotide-binding universal stress UspA family protein